MKTSLCLGPLAWIKIKTELAGPTRWQIQVLVPVLILVAVPSAFGQTPLEAGMWHLHHTWYGPPGLPALGQ